MVPFLTRAWGARKGGSALVPAQMLEVSSVMRVTMESLEDWQDPHRSSRLVVIRLIPRVATAARRRSADGSAEGQSCGASVAQRG